MINRLDPDPFYLSKRAESRTSGTHRRSLPNFHQLVKALQSNGYHVIATSLEGKSLAYQIALFEGSFCIIAQHGAALANIVFALEGSHIIEIIPEKLKSGTKAKKFLAELTLFFGIRHFMIQRSKIKYLFAELASSLGVRHSSVVQPGLHGPVDPELLIATLSTTIC